MARITSHKGGNVEQLRQRTREAAVETQAKSRMSPSRFAGLFNGKVDDLDVERARYVRLNTAIETGHVAPRDQKRADAACAAAVKLWDAVVAQVNAGDTTAAGKALFAKIREDLGW